MFSSGQSLVAIFVRTKKNNNIIDFSHQKTRHQNNTKMVILHQFGIVAVQLVAAAVMKSVAALVGFVEVAGFLAVDLGSAH